MVANLVWNNTEKKVPPEETILLVSGPLGIDLAIYLDGQWYFKSGDDWSPTNLEHWSKCTPIQWAIFNIPENESKQHKSEYLSDIIVKQIQKLDLHQVP